MSKKSLPKTKYINNKSIEKRENAVLEILLNDSVLTQMTGGDDDFPNTDGYFHLLTESREVSGQLLQIQVKALSYTKKGEPYSTCKPTLLAHAHDSSTPVLLIGVDVKNNTAYWSYLSPEFVNEYISQRKNIPEKTITIHFPKKNKIEATDSKYTEVWKKICLHHRNESNDKIISRYIRTLDKGVVQERTSPERLKTLQQLAFYRTNDGKFPLVDLVISMFNEVKKADTTSRASYLDVLKEIVYQKPKDVLAILFSFLGDEDVIKASAKKIIIEVSKYNFHILNSLGYAPQRTLLDLIPSFLSNGNLEVQKFIIEILENLIEPSFDGTSNPTLWTITFHRGNLQATPYLEKIRKDAINLLFEMIEHDESLKVQIQSLKTLQRALHFSDNGFSDEQAETDFRSMLDRESKYIVSKYKKIVLDSKNKPIEIFPLVCEVEVQLALLKVWKREVPGQENLLNILRTSKSDYQLYRMLIGDEIRIEIDIGYNEAKKQKEDSIVKAINSITEKNIFVWYERLQKISQFKDYTDEWHFNFFRDFLARLAVQKPALADKLLNRIFKEKGSLYSFAGSILFGFRRSSIPLWNKYVSQIQKEKSTTLTINILQSFETRQREDLRVSQKEIDLITDIAQSNNSFSFLEKENPHLRYQVMRSLVYLSVVKPETFKILILNQSKDYPGFWGLFFDHLGTALHFNWIDFSNWTTQELEQIADALVKIPSLDYNEEQVLNQIGKKGFELMMSVYGRRISQEGKQPGSRYDAFPYHFSTDISTLIANHPQYPKILRKWISKTNERRDLYAMRLGKLIHTIGGKVLTQVIDELIATKKDTNIKRVVALFPLLEVPNFDVCFKIIDVTDDERILREIEGRMRSTGMLSGSHGDNLHGNAMRSVRENFTQVLSKTPSPRIKKFCKRAIHNLDIDIARSDKDHEKHLKEERENFEADSE